MIRAPVVRLDARTLRPLPPGLPGATLPPGLDVIDTTLAARAAQRPVREREPGLRWDPLQPAPVPALRCSFPDPDP